MLLSATMPQAMHPASPAVAVSAVAPTQGSGSGADSNGGTAFSPGPSTEMSSPATITNNNTATLGRSAAANNRLQNDAPNANVAYNNQATPSGGYGQSMMGTPPAFALQHQLQKPVFTAAPFSPGQGQSLAHHSPLMLNPAMMYPSAAAASQFAPFMARPPRAPLMPSAAALMHLQQQLELGQPFVMRPPMVPHNVVDDGYGSAQAANVLAQQLRMANGHHMIAGAVAPANTETLQQQNADYPQIQWSRRLPDARALAGLTAAAVQNGVVAGQANGSGHQHTGHWHGGSYGDSSTAASSIASPRMGAEAAMDGDSIDSIILDLLSAPGSVEQLSRLIDGTGSIPSETDAFHDKGFDDIMEESVDDLLLSSLDQQLAMGFRSDSAQSQPPLHSESSSEGNMKDDDRGMQNGKRRSRTVDTARLGWPEHVPALEPVLIFDVANSLFSELHCLDDTPLSTVRVLPQPDNDAQRLPFVLGTEFTDSDMKNHISGVENTLSVGFIDLDEGECHVLNTDGEFDEIPERKSAPSATGIDSWKLPLAEHIRSVRWAKDGEYFVCAAGKKLLMFKWPAAQGEEGPCELACCESSLHLETVRALDLNAEGHLLHGGFDGRLQIVDTKAGAAPNCALGPIRRRLLVPGSIGSISWAPSHQSLAGFTTDEGTFRLIDQRAPELVVLCHTAQRAKDRSSDVDSTEMYAHTFLDTEKEVVLGFSDGFMARLDLRAGSSAPSASIKGAAPKIVHEWRDPVVRCIGDLSYSPTGKLVCATGLGGLSMTSMGRGKAVTKSGYTAGAVAHEYSCSGHWVGQEPIFVMVDSVGRICVCKA